MVLVGPWCKWKEDENATAMTAVLVAVVGVVFES